MRIKFWPEFPYIFRDYHKEVPNFQQTPEQIEHMFKKKIEKKHRRALRNLKNQDKGGFNVSNRTQSKV